MSALDDLLRDAADQVREELEQLPIPAPLLHRRGRRPNSTTSVVAVLAAAAVVVVITSLVALASHGRDREQRKPRPPAGATTPVTAPSTTVTPTTAATPRASTWHEVFGSSTVLDEQGLTLLGRDDRQMVALGHQLCGGPTDAALVWATTDLSNWTPGLVSRGNLSTTSSICPWVTAVAATPDGQSFVAVGTAGDAQRTIGRVWRSSDGIHWTSVGATAFDNGQLSTVVSGHGLLVAGGEAAHLQQSLGQFVAWSDDGTSWRRANLSNDGEISQVVSGPAGFLAIGHGSGLNDGQMSVWSSPDGQHWTAGRGLDAKNVVQEEGFATAHGYSILASDGISGAKVLYEWADGRRWTRSGVTGLANLDSVGSIATIGSRLIAIGEARSASPNGYTQAMWVSHDAGHAWARVAIPTAVSEHTVFSSILASGDKIFVGGGFYPDPPPAAKPAAVPRIWSLTID
jgi:hypothetical protein